MKQLPLIGVIVTAAMLTGGCDNTLDTETIEATSSTREYVEETPLQICLDNFELEDYPVDMSIEELTEHVNTEAMEHCDIILEERDDG